MLGITHSPRKCRSVGQCHAQSLEMGVHEYMNHPPTYLPVPSTVRGRLMAVLFMANQAPCCLSFQHILRSHTEYYSLRKRFQIVFMRVPFRYNSYTIRTCPCIFHQKSVICSHTSQSFSSSVGTTQILMTFRSNDGILLADINYTQPQRAIC